MPLHGLELRNLHHRSASSPTRSELEKFPESFGRGPDSITYDRSAERLRWRGLGSNLMSQDGNRLSASTIRGGRLVTIVDVHLPKWSGLSNYSKLLHGVRHISGMGLRDASIGGILVGTVTA